jgi:hypothetical protein
LSGLISLCIRERWNVFAAADVVVVVVFIFVLYLNFLFFFYFFFGEK